jgi:hypothetical protein
MHPIESEAVPDEKPGRLANVLTFALAFIACGVGFFGRLIGLLLVAWNVASTPIDPVWPLECVLAAPLALIALTSAFLLRLRNGRSRLLRVSIVLGAVALIWSLIVGLAFLSFDGGSV